MRYLVLLFAILATLSHANRGRGRPRPGHVFGNYIAVCNRNNNSFSLVNPDTFKPVTHTLPDGGEPMYFVCLYRTFEKRPAELWVGDRANNRLAILRLERDKIVPDGFLPTPAGLFHSMTTQNINARNPLAYSTCDIDNLVVVHDIRSRRKLCTIERPKEIADLDAKPHDVTGIGKYVFVTFVGASNGFGYVASYNVKRCKLITYIRTAKDPHIAVRQRTRLWIAAQGGEVLSRSVPILAPLSNDTSQSSPHGMFISFNRKFLYVTNIADEGKNAVVVFNQKNGKKRYCPQIDTTYPTPHNPTASFNGKKLYITHSIGDKPISSAWDIAKNGCLIPGSEVIFETGNNPFGTAVVPPPSGRLLRRAVNS